MKSVLGMCIVLLCIVSIAFANPYSKADNDHRQIPINPDKDMIRYRPALRQNDVLFVEDIAGIFGPVPQPDPLWDSLLTELIGTANYGWFTTAADTSNGPDLATMQQYDLVVWNCYDYYLGPPAYPMALTDADQLAISDYLSNGGKLWLIGQDILWSGVPMPWMATHFFLADAVQDYHSGPLYVNVQGLNEISGFSMTVWPDYVISPFGWTDELIPDTLFAHGVIEDTDSNKVIGIFYPGQMDWQSAFWTIDLRDAVWFYWGEIIGMVGGMFDAFGVTGINELPAEPIRQLNLNISPAPFVHSTTISFEVPTATHVTLNIYSKTGQYVTTLMDSRQNAGSYRVAWNRKDVRGSEVPNGVYFVRLTCGETTATANIVIAK